MKTATSLKQRLEWLEASQPNNLSAINALRLKMGLPVAYRSMDDVKKRLKWLEENQPNNLVAINAMRSPLGLPLLKPKPKAA